MMHSFSYSIDTMSRSVLCFVYMHLLSNKAQNLKLPTTTMRRKVKQSLSVLRTVRLLQKRQTVPMGFDPGAKVPTNAMCSRSEPRVDSVIDRAVRQGSLAVAWVLGSLRAGPSTSLALALSTRLGNPLVDARLGIIRLLAFHLTFPLVSIELIGCLPYPPITIALGADGRAPTRRRCFCQSAREVGA